MAICTNCGTSVATAVCPTATDIYGSGPTASCSTTCGCLHGRAYHDRRLYWHFFVADAPAHQYDMSYYLGMRRLS